MTQSRINWKGEYRKVDVREGYDLWAPTYDKAPNPLFQVEERIMSELIGNVQGKQVLDIGCGTGRYCVLLAERGASVVGIDSSPKMLEQARQKMTPTCQFVVRYGTAEEITFSDNHFDLVISALTLGHLQDPEPALKEAARVLRNDSQMVISDFHPYWIVSGHNYSEFFDNNGRQYCIPIYPHLIEDYWYIFKRIGLHLDDIREPTLSEKTIELIPFARHVRGVPMVLLFNLHKSG
jgi:ubiquinone/menaquinone biosynthesis C-methylase UbiE